MLLKRFKGTGPDVIILIFIIVLSVWVSSFLNPKLPSSLHFDTNPMPLFSVLETITGNNPLAGVLFSFLLVLLIAFLLVSFNTSVLFISERTFLPALIYILLTGLFPEYQILNPVLPAAVFLVLAARRIMDAYRMQGTAFNFFDAGLLISTGSLFYANFIWFGLLVIIGIALLRTGNLREIIISILGLTTPWLLTFGLFYVIGKDISSFISVVKYNLFMWQIDYIFSGATIVALIFFGIIILVSFVHMMTLMNTRKIRARKTFYLLIWAFLISAGMFLILQSVSVEIFWLAGIPASYFMSHYFVFVKKKLVPEILFTLLFMLVALIQILYIF